jgi:hypothetical protein
MRPVFDQRLRSLCSFPVDQGFLKHIKSRFSIKGENDIFMSKKVLNYTLNLLCPLLNGPANTH